MMQEALFDVPVETKGAMIPPEPPTSAQVPQEYTSLYQDYLLKVHNRVKVATIMWVILDYGNEIEMLDKWEHVERVKGLLKSGDKKKEQVAVEVMSRTLGIWRSR